MLRPLTTAAATAALLLAPVAFANVPADGGSVSDETGDYTSYFPKTDAPRASIDIKKATAGPAKVNGRRGTTVTVKIRDVRTAAESTTVKQRFVVVTSAEDDAVTFRRDGKVIGFVGDTKKACPHAVRSFDTDTDKVSVFIPNTCVGSFSAAVVETLTQDSQRIYSDDTTDLFSW